MANPEHLAKLEEGIDAWNEWRKAHPGVQIDLGGAMLLFCRRGEIYLRNANLRLANLSRANLSGAGLRGANLIDANLSGALLSEANLTNANLQGAQLIDAHLIDANLTRANLTRANLSRADLSRADLRGAILIGAILIGANLNQAMFWETGLGDTLLQNAKDLDEIRFIGPCVLDSRTIRKSWPLPDSFLKGCGLSDWEIEAAKLHQRGLTSHEQQEINHRVGQILAGRLDLLLQPIQFFTCFISYSHQDEQVTKAIHKGLDRKGVRSWYAPEDLKIGDKILDRIDQAIRVHDKLLVILSEASISNEWVEDEVTTAFEEERKRKTTVLFPIRLDNAVMDSSEPWAAKVRQRHIGDFTNWQKKAGFNKAFERLIRDLEQGA